MRGSARLRNANFRTGCLRKDANERRRRRHFSEVKDQHHFFAMREDLVPGLEYIESQRRLEYHLYEMRADQEFVFLDSLLKAADLGVSATGDTTKDRDYFVYPRESRPSIRAIPQRRGGTMHMLEPTSQTVHLRCGGLHEASGALIAGRVARAVQANG